MADANSLGRCIVCDKGESECCKQCRNAHYCSKDCQRNDWPTHKLICEAYSRFDISSRPDKNHILGLLFPVDSKKPQIVWLDTNRSPLGGYQDGKDDQLLGGDLAGTAEPLMYNTVLKRALSNTIFIRYRDGFLIDGSKLNQSVAAIQATRDGNSHDWRGPVVLNACRGPGMEPSHCKDFDMVDYRHLVDHLHSYNPQPIPESVIKNSPYTIVDFNPKARKIQAVRINCSADQERMGRPAFEQVEIRASDEIFTTHDTSDVADRIGIPIFTAQLKPDPEWKSDTTLSRPLQNQDATYLHICCNIEDVEDEDEYLEMDGYIGWGCAGWKWQHGVGSVIVVRQDKKPLWPVHVQALCGYIREDIMRYIEHFWGGVNEEEPMSKELALSFICKPGFEIYWNKFCEDKKVVEEEETGETPHPYRV